jgi:plastocyanin
VTSATGSTDTYTSSLANGATFTHQFLTAGTYEYYCQIHGTDRNGATPPGGMHGTITVNP